MISEEDTFLALKRTHFKVLLTEVYERGFTRYITDVFSEELNNILIGANWTMDDFIDEYNRNSTRNNGYVIRNITPTMYVTREHG